MMTKDLPSRSTPDLQGHNDLGMTDAVSPVRHINVLKPANGDARLPRPVITDADGNKLDLSSFPGNTTITCVPWPLIAVGQKVWLAADGTLANGDPTTLSLWAASGVNASEVRDGFRKTLPRSWLESLRDGSTITVRLNVTFNGSIEKAGNIGRRKPPTAGERRRAALRLHVQ